MAKTSRYMPDNEAVRRRQTESRVPAERILDIALELFTTQGYDKTSLREIAEQLGFSKAAIYYHFESKEDILMALHMRLHDIGLDALRNIDRERLTLDVWSTLIDRMIDQMLEHRRCSSSTSATARRWSSCTTRGTKPNTTTSNHSFARRSPTRTSH